MDRRLANRQNTRARLLVRLTALAAIFAGMLASGGPWEPCFSPSSCTSLFPKASSLFRIPALFRAFRKHRQASAQRPDAAAVCVRRNGDEQSLRAGDAAARRRHGDANSACEYQCNAAQSLLSDRSGRAGTVFVRDLGDGLSMYTLDPTTGAVAELAASPFAVSTGNSGMLVIAESTGQYVYLLKAILPGMPTVNSLIVDIFQIDASTPALIPVSSQSIAVAGEFVGAVKDPQHHGVAVYLNQAVNGSNYPSAVLYTIQFNAVSGQLILDPSGGVSNDSEARTIAVSPTGNYLATGSGEATGSLNVYQVSQGSFSLANIGGVQLGSELNVYSFPDSIYFNSNGELICAQGPPAQNTGSGLPFYIYESATTLEIPSSPIAIADANFLSATLDPQGPFRYATVSSGGIQVYSWTK